MNRPTTDRRLSRHTVGEAVLSVLALGVGLLLILRPFSSVRPLALALAAGLLIAGAAELLRAWRERRPLSGAGLAGLILVGTGLAAALWPGLSIFGLAVTATVGLLVLALRRLLAAITGREDPRPAARWADGLFAAAAVALAVVALAWPGVSIFVVTLCVGAALIWFAVSRLIRLRYAPPAAEFGEHSPRPALRLAAAAGAALVAVPLAVLTVTVQARAPRPAEFYSAELPGEAVPGTLLRSEPFHREVPDSARGWRLLYVTTDGQNRPILASGLVVAPKAPSAGPHPVVAWAHGTTGVAQACAPSNLAEPFTAGATPALAEVIDRGWALVATDYPGLGTAGPTPYVIGQGEARSVLDAVRAARQLTDLTLAEQTVAWGHSQGGHASLWTGTIAGGYAPDVPLSGVAALAPAADLLALAEGLESMTGGGLFAAYVIDAYSRYYPDVRLDDYVNPTGRLPVRGMASRCLSSADLPVSIIEALIVGNRMYARSPDSGALGRRLTQNSVHRRIDVPVLLAQGDDDSLIQPAAQQATAARLCHLGTPLDFREYPGREHLSLVADDSPAVADLLRWTAARLAGEPAATTCAP